MAEEEAVIRIVLQDEGGSARSSPAQPPSTQQSPQQQSTPQRTNPPPPASPPASAPPPPPRPAPVDARAVEGYQAISRAVNAARHDADAFGKSMEGVHGQLFKIRHGIDPQSIAEIFRNGGDAADDLLKNLTEINTLVGQGAIGQDERLKLVKAEVSRATTDTPPAQQKGSAATATGGGEPDWIKKLVDGIEGANRHVLIEGQSGSGKSLMARHVAFQRMEKGEDVHVVDPHTPEQWKGAKQVFARESAGTDAAKFLRETLRGREKEQVEAKARGEQVDFKPLTVVFSDFARLLKDAPKLGDELRTLLTEARKFNIAIVADTTALTGAETGVKGIQNIRENFAQKVKMKAPTGEDPQRRAEVGGKTYDTPVLPDYKDRFDPTIVREPTPPPPPEPRPEPVFDPAAEAQKRREAERRSAQVNAAYKEQFGGGEDGESQLTKMLSVAGRFRGVIGGFAGTLIGIGLDVVAAFVRAQVEVKSKQREAQLLAESNAPKPLPSPPPVPPTQAAPSIPTQIPLEAPELPELPAIETPESIPVSAPEAMPTAVKAPPVIPPAPVVAPPTIPPAPVVAPPIIPPEPVDGARGAVPSESMQTTTAQPTVSETNTEKQQAPAPPEIATQKPQEAPKSPSTVAAGAAAPKTTPKPPVTAANTAGVATTARAAATAAAPAATTAGAAGGGGAAAGGAAAAGAGGAGGGAAGGAAAAAGAAGPVGIVILAVVALGLAAKAVADEMKKTTERLSDYNADIAAATARAEVRQIYGDIRRAEQAAPTLSRFTDASSRLSERAEDLKIQFMESVGPVIIEMLNAANIVVQILSGILKGHQEIIQLIASVPLISDILKLLSDAWDWVKRRFGIGEDEEIDTAFDVIVNDLFANIDF